MKRTTLITFGLSLAACSSSPTSSSSQLSTEDYEDTAQAIASQACTGKGGGGGVGGGDVLALADALNLAKGRLPLGFSRHGDGRFHGDHMGIDNAFTITCTDAAGATQAQCDKTTDAAKVELSWKGSIETPNFSSSIDREGSWTITGLQSDTATFGGDSSFSLDTTMTSVFHAGVTSSLTIDATASYDAITVSTAEQKITGGSATFDVKGHRTVTGTEGGAKDVDKSLDMSAVLTFNGDDTATLVLNGTETFTIELKSGGLRHGGRHGGRDDGDGDGDGKGGH